MKLHFRQMGSGQALLILHGVFGSSDNWLSIGRMLSESFLVYLIDQRNHGLSPHDDDFSYEAMSADLMEFIDDHTLTNVILMGHSMGGKTVMQFAMNYPEAYQKMIVVDIAPRYYPIHHHKILKGLRAISLHTLRTRQEADVILAHYESDAGVRQFLLKNLYRQLPENIFEWRINLPIIGQEIANVGSEITVRHILEKPTLFIRGQGSPYITQEDVRGIEQIFRNVSIETIAEAGHWVQADQPAIFVKNCSTLSDGVTYFDKTILAPIFL